jgi:peptidoglycan/xylan/chitin deacetylase (PgdA/CDA1 family)
MNHEFWVIVDSSRYANQEAFTTTRARRVLAILDPHDLPAQFLVVGDDRKFHTVCVQDCQLHKIEDNRGVFIDLG